MKKSLFVCIFSLFAVLSFRTAQAMESIFYLTQDTFNNTLFTKAVLDDIQNHNTLISILAPQVYSFTDNGLVVGDLDPALIQFAKKNNIKLMPLVTNSGFSQDIVRNTLKDPRAKERLLDALLSLCKMHNFYGIQLDIEHVNYQDRDALTQFIQTAAEAFHKNGYAFSIAVVPPLEPAPLIYDAYQKWVFENWSGAYDFAALSKSVDFLTLMAYDYNSQLTTPGPISPIKAVEKSLNILLADKIPADKISLGIPLYSGYWTMTPNAVEADGSYKKPSFILKRATIDYTALSTLLAAVKKPLLWDEEAQVPYLIVNQYGRYGFLYVENARAFQAKLDLVNRYHLRGFSAWKIPMEDPGIWEILKNLKPSS